MSTITIKPNRKPENSHERRAEIERLIDHAISYVAAQGATGTITAKINIMPGGGIGSSYVTQEITNHV